MIAQRRPALQIAAYYFFYYGAIGTFIPYIALHYQRIGLGGEQIGLLTALAPAVLLIAGPLWGAIGDRFNLHRHLLPIATLGAVLPAVLMAFTDSLAGLIFLTVTQAFFSTAIGPLADSAALEISSATRVPFGQLRIGGSIGFMVISVATGWLLVHVSTPYLFFAYAACMIIAALVAMPLPARRHYWNAPIWDGLGLLIRQPSFAVFLAVALLVGASAMAVGNFFPLHIAAIGGDASVIGIAGAIGALSELPILYNSDKVLRRMGGLWAGMATGVAVYAVRWWLLSLMTSPALIMALQLSHSISFGLYLISSVAYADSLAPEGLAATAQSLLVAASFGLGAMIGSLGGGVLYANVGAATLFQIAGIVNVLALGLLFWIRIRRRQ